MGGLALNSTTQDSTSKPFEVAIVGGGLGGVILAIGLLRQGVSVKIYEAAATFGEIGAGIACGPNAVRALSLISPDLLAAYKKHATFNRSPDLAESWLQLLYGMDSRNGNGKVIGDFACNIRVQQDDETGTLPRGCVHRASFLDEIIKLLPKNVATFKKRLVDLKEALHPGDGSLCLHFADGTIAAADAVIGCDGIKSVTRRFLYGPEARPEYTHAYGYRALVPAAACEAVMGADMTYNGQMWVGYGGCIVSYPVEHQKYINLVAIVHKPDNRWEGETWLLPASMEEMNSDLQGWHPGLVQLLREYSPRDKWALFDFMHNKKYARGRVCLLGDACHASTAHLGAGAGQAMEDAYILSNLLGKVENPDHIPLAFSAYDTVRRPRSQWVCASSRRSGRTLFLSEDEVGDDMSKVQELQDKTYARIWGENLPGQLQRALTLLEVSSSGSF